MLDYKKFAADLGLADDDKAALIGLFEKKPDLSGKLETMFTTQVDERVAPLKADLEAKQRDLDAQFDTLASLRGNDEQAIGAAEKRIEELSAQSAVLQARLRRVATEAGMDAEAILKDVSGEVVPEKKVETPAFDPATVIAQANRSALSAFENAALMEDLAAEHQTLFGKPMSRVELIQTLKDTVKRTGNQNLGLREVFETKFDVAKKREELREVDVQKRIDAAVAARETALRDEAALRVTQPQVDPTRKQSPIFETIKREGEQPAHIGGLPPAVVASIADYRRRVAERKSA